MKPINKLINCLVPQFSILVFSALLPISVSATTLSGNLTADDAFTVYLSTDDSIAGTPLVSGSFWPSAQSFSTALTPGNTYYLHIAAKDVFGAPSAFLGSFSLSDTNFTFANETQTLVSNSVDWKVNATGFGLAYNTPYDGFGANGIGPWGTMSSIASDARWIWTGPSGTVGKAYFTATITAVPEPETYVMLLAGLGLLGFMARCRKESTV